MTDRLTDEQECKIAEAIRVYGGESTRTPIGSLATCMNTIKVVLAQAQPQPVDAALLASHKKLVEALTSIRDQVANGRLCYFGDHTGYEPQIGSNQVEQWTAALHEAQKAGE